MSARAGSVVVDAAVVSLVSDQAAKDAAQALKTNADAGTLCDEATFGPCTVKDIKVKKRAVATPPASVSRSAPAKDEASVAATNAKAIKDAKNTWEKDKEEKKNTANATSM